MPVRGAQPAGTEDEQGAATAVREMFDSIAPRYDLLNHVLSMNIDRLWWWRAARRFRRALAHPDARVMDICCGTGDMTMALLRRRPSHSQPILAADFSHPMLLRGAAKFALRGAHAIEADALRLPLAADTLDLVVSAFGFRNLANYQVGLQEFHRVLKPQGELGILDFNQPRGMLGKVYALYFRHLLPAIGSALSGSVGAYAYLPASVKQFPTPPEMLAMLNRAGFTEVSWTPYSFGIAGLYRGVKR